MRVCSCRRAAVYRAVENRVPVVKADYGWDSAFVDACGTSEVVRSRDAAGARLTLVREVPVGDGGGTVASALRDSIGWLGALVCLWATTSSWLWWWAARTRRRA